MIRRILEYGTGDQETVMKQLIINNCRPVIATHLGHLLKNKMIQ